MAATAPENGDCGALCNRLCDMLADKSDLAFACAIATKCIAPTMLLNREA